MYPARCLDGGHFIIRQLRKLALTVLAVEPILFQADLCAIIAGEALSLFCSPKAARVGICGGGNCGWLFLDESRGKRRRWCDMNDCGSRSKPRRNYEKHKAS
ncbi:MAG: CGNR zinc finger domain-containing protein, partial [Terracidiphilus sp.]